MTVRGWGLLIAALALTITGRVLGITELFALAMAAVVMLLGARIYVGQRRDSLRVACHAVPGVVHAGESAHVEVEVTNIGLRTSPPMLLHQRRARRQTSAELQLAGMAIPVLEPGEVARADLPVDTSHRGVFESPRLEAVVEDPVGLICRRNRVGGEVRLTVLPKVVSLQDLAPFLGFNPRLESTRSTAIHLGTGYSSFRRYDEGDDLRLVHWKTSARVGELMVREGGDPEAPETRSTTVLLDTRQGVYEGEGFEEAVSAAASSLVSGFLIGSAVRLVTSAGADIRAGRDPWHLEETLVALASVETERDEGLRRARRALAADDLPGILVVVTGARHGDDMADLMSGQLGPVLVVMIGDSPAGSARTVPADVPLVRVRPGEALFDAWSRGLEAARKDGSAAERLRGWSGEARQAQMREAVSRRSLLGAEEPPRQQGDIESWKAGAR